MSDKPDQESPTSDIIQELRALGQNLKGALQSAWDSEERKKLAHEIETGLNDLGTTLSQAARDFTDSSTGQTLKADVQDFQERLRTGEVESKVRSEIVSALRTVNTELQKVIRKPPDEPGTGQG